MFHNEFFVQFEADNRHRALSPNPAKAHFRYKPTRRRILIRRSIGLWMIRVGTALSKSVEHNDSRLPERSVPV